MSSICSSRWSKYYCYNRERSSWIIVLLQQKPNPVGLDLLNFALLNFALVFFWLESLGHLATLHQQPLKIEVLLAPHMMSVIATK